MGIINDALEKLADDYMIRNSAAGTATTDAGGYIITNVPSATTIPLQASVGGGRTALLANIDIGGTNTWCIRVLEKDTLSLCKNTSVSWYMSYLESPQLGG